MVLQNVGFVCQQIYTGFFVDVYVLVSFTRNCILSLFFFALARKLKQRAIYRHEYILISKGNYLIFANLVKTFILYYC